jgi:hypothetical protein
MVIEFEFWNEETPVDRPSISRIEVRSNTEAENVAYQWLRDQKSALRQRLNPRTKQDYAYFRSLVALLHVSLGLPIDRFEDGTHAYEGKRY